jgi:hypothetical protein
MVAGEHASMGHRHAMRVAGEVLEDRLGACERPLRVDDPLRLAQGGDKLVPGKRGRQGLALPMQAHSALGHGLTQSSEKGAAEEATEHLDREEEAAGAPVARPCHPRGDRLQGPGNAHADDDGVAGPRYATPRESRSPRPDVWAPGQSCGGSPPLPARAGYTSDEDAAPLTKESLLSRETTDSQMQSRRERTEL